MEIYYDTYVFTPTSVTRDGYYSRYDSNLGAFIVGDGENLDFTIATNAAYANPNITSVVIGDAVENDQKDKVSIHQAGSMTRQSIRHNRDYNPSSGFYGNHDPNFGVTDVVRTVPLIGNVIITYAPRKGLQKTFKIPVYVEVRDNHSGRSY
jgi:hypothetical protein